MTQAELDKADEALDSLKDRWEARDQQPLSPQDEAKLQAYVDLMTAPA